MAYSISNKCAENLCKWTVLVQLIIKNMVTRFFGTQCTILNKVGKVVKNLARLLLLWSTAAFTKYQYIHTTS